MSTLKLTKYVSKPTLRSCSKKKLHLTKMKSKLEINCLIVLFLISHKVLCNPCMYYVSLLMCFMPYFHFPVIRQVFKFLEDSVKDTV